ncbi:hypothetical protein HK103_001908 [Boothiomyces macroporosus]|uniref:Uncharacterized protein n=1 Tax=Boothiomyces macroporosus TaxID=261099 RepID=A0AAD5UJD0_9FUNG|nr:hypothetical protein HK103_001908 [Boothiomyces macroporosus]
MAVNMKFFIALLATVAVNAVVIPQSSELVARDPAKTKEKGKKKNKGKGKAANRKGANGKGASGKGANGKGGNGKAVNGKGANDSKAVVTNTNTNASNDQRLPPCGNLNGSLCTSSGSFAVTSAEALIAKCNACGAAAGASGAGKLADCLAKVKGGDRNPAMPANTFGHTPTCQ